MTFYGLSSYDRCIELMKIIKSKNITEISQDEIAKMIAINIGSSKFYKTVRNYIAMMVNFKMVEQLPNGNYIIHYEVLNDK